MPDPERPCPVCGRPAAVEVLRREGVPVHQNLLFGDPAQARNVTRGVLALSVCGGCGFAFNHAFDPCLLDYGTRYEGSQACSPEFSAQLDGLVRDLVAGGIRGRRILEVGCGAGTFLRRLVAYPGGENRGVGFDPAYLGPEVELGGRLRFYRRAYGEGCADGAADVVVCRHVIEHVADPLGLLRAMGETLARSGEPRLLVETPCLDWILDHQVAWDLFYEHCSLFTAAALITALGRAGFRPTSMRRLFGRQYLWAEGAPGPGGTHEPPGQGTVVARAQGLARGEAALIAARRALLERQRRRGPVAVWGAGAKGATFCNLVDPTGERVACVVDVNPRKQGRYVAGTGHPIASPAQAGEAGIAVAIVLNPNYVAEVRAELRRLRLQAVVIDLMKEGDGARCS
ncbi:MAG TPA: class I SAM-dependent methyltransferase [Candidatus Methylomirabilis sp.]